MYLLIYSSGSRPKYRADLKAQFSLLNNTSSLTIQNITYKATSLTIMNTTYNTTSLTTQNTADNTTSLTIQSTTYNTTSLTIMNTTYNTFFNLTEPCWNSTNLVVGILENATIFVMKQKNVFGMFI